MNANYTTAPQNTKCSPAGYRCETGKDAAHIVNGRPLCGFHSPYDVKPVEVVEVAETATEVPAAGSDSSQWTEAQKAAYRAETAQLMASLSRSMDESHARIAGPADTREHAKAYSQYVSDGIADTDGYFAPLSYDRWVHFFGPQA